MFMLHFSGGSSLQSAWPVLNCMSNIFVVFAAEMDVLAARNGERIY